MAVAVITPASSLKRSLALTSGSAKPYQEEVKSTDHSDAWLQGTGGIHPQHRCGLLRECLCSTAPVFDPPPLCDIPSGFCFFTGPWTVTRSSLCMLRRVAAFCRPLRPVLLLVSFPRLRSPVVGVLGLCWMWPGVPFARQWRPVVGVLRLCWLLRGRLTVVAVHRPSIPCLAVFPCA